MSYAALDSCKHIKKYKEEFGELNYKIICGCIVSPNTKDTLLTKAQCCICQLCLTYTPRLHACMYCAYFGCYKLGHIHDHAHLENHNLAVDVSYGVVYCFLCRDYVYDMEFESILRKHKREQSRFLGMVEPYYPWEASKLQLKILDLNPERRLISRNTYLGLRGLRNLGHTCFVNCILQLLMHTPLLRDYFLSGRHSCQGRNRSCMACEMSTLFQEFYSGITEPFMPSELLYVVWENADYLAAYDQQDAHEFFLAILNILHQHFEGEEGFSNDVNDCHCIVHKIYTGKTKIDIICGDCGNDVASHFDHFLNISLVVGSEPREKSSGSSAHGKASSQSDEASTTLFQCLESYIRVESLKDPHTCFRCQKKDKSSVQSTIMKLPIIISFHFKRLQQSNKKKKKNFISFPEVLDMTPYMSPFHQSKSSSGKLNDGCSDTSSNRDNEYCLFAVVNHEGTVKGGHYTCYIRPMGDQWFKCDDACITTAHTDDVFSSEVYLLFYHKKVLEYQ